LNQIYNNNLEALAEKNYRLAQKINKLTTKKNDFSIISTKDESDYVLQVEINNKSKLVNSVYSPTRTAKQKIDGLDLEYYNLIGVSGFGCGYYIEELINQFNKDSRVVILENRLDILKEVMKYRDLTNIFGSENIVIFDGTNSDYFINMKQQLKAINYMALLAGNIDFFEMPVLQEKYENAYKEFQTKFISLMRYLAKVMGNAPGDSLIGIENIFKNIEILLRSQNLETITEYQNKPAVCVAAGPSLDKNIDVLKEYQNEVLIIAADTILERLIDEDIIPDIVGVLERGEKPYKYFFEELFNNNKLPPEVTLVGEGVMHKETCNRLQGKKVITLRDTVYSESWFVRNISGVTGYDAGNSVATLNFSTALSLGCDPIILVGQDLAFGQNGERHTGGTGYDSNIERKISEQEIVEVEGYYGGKVKARKVWWQFKQWFEYKIEETGVKCIDATEGGAYIEGSHRMDLSEVAEKYFNSEELLFCNAIDDIAQEKYLKRAIKLKEAVEKKLDIFQELKEQASSIKEWIEEILDILEDKKEKENFVLRVFPDINSELVILTRTDDVFYFVAQPVTIEMERNKVRIGDLKEDTESKFMAWCAKNLDVLEDIEEIIEELINSFSNGKDKLDKLIAKEED
jgi:hypothetical protein